MMTHFPYRDTSGIPYRKNSKTLVLCWDGTEGAVGVWVEPTEIDETTPTCMLCIMLGPQGRGRYIST